MFTITKTPTSIRIASPMTGESITVLLTEKKTEIHRSVEDKNLKAASQLSSQIRTVVARTMSKKLAWTVRFDKVYKALEGSVGTAKTFRVLANNFEKIAEEKFSAN